jgi:putative (di)nucleoside polyphosphate hydrolase
MILFASMKETIDTRFFRAGVGTVIYNSDGEVAFFERAQNPVGVWQFQQGGVDLGEDTKTTLWRELKEEIGLTEDDFETVTEYPKWTVYQYDHTLDDNTKSRLGQAHRWYFLKLKDTVSIDLTKATEYEASDFKWMTFQEVLSVTGDFKKHVYQELATYFSDVIQSID